MDGAGGIDGRAHTLRDGLAHRQGHHCRRYAERVFLRHHHAGHGDDEHGVRHPWRAMLGIRLHGLCGQSALCDVSQHPAAGLLGYRQIRPLRAYHPHDHRRECAAERLPADTGREREGTLQTGAVDPDVPGHRCPSVTGVPGGTPDTEFLALPYYFARG